MELPLLFAKQFKDTVERILHVPGNYDGSILEMTVVVDTYLSKEEVKELLPELLRTLKMHSKIFQNVRFNFVLWESDHQIKNQVCPMAMAMMDSFYQDYEQKATEKHLENLAAYLKKFHARSKVILVLTDGAYQVEDTEELDRQMKPFLEKKWMFVVRQEKEWAVEYRRIGF